MHDPYARQPGQAEEANTGVMLVKVPGILLLMLGVGIALWVVVSLAGLLTGNAAPALVQAVVPKTDDPVTLGLPDGKFTLPHQVFTPIGYLLVCFVYSVIATVAGLLINGGVSLLQSDSNKLLRRLLDRLERRGAS